MNIILGKQIAKQASKYNSKLHFVFKLFLPEVYFWTPE